MCVPVRTADRRTAAMISAAVNDNRTCLCTRWAIKRDYIFYIQPSAYFMLLFLQTHTKAAVSALFERFTRADFVDRRG